MIREPTFIFGSSWRCHFSPNKKSRQSSNNWDSRLPQPHYSSLSSTCQTLGSATAHGPLQVGAYTWWPPRVTMTLKVGTTGCIDRQNLNLYLLIDLLHQEAWLTALRRVSKKKLTRMQRKKYRSMPAKSSSYGKITSRIEEARSSCYGNAPTQMDRNAWINYICELL